MSVHYKIRRILLRRLNNGYYTGTLSVRYVTKDGVSSVTRYLYQTLKIGATRDYFVLRVGS